MRTQIFLFVSLAILALVVSRSPVQAIQACRVAPTGDYKIGTLLTDSNSPAIQVGTGGPSSDGRKTIYSHSELGMWFFGIYDKAAKVMTLQNKRNDAGRYFVYSLNFQTVISPIRIESHSLTYYLFHNDVCNIALPSEPHDITVQELTIRKKQ